MGERGRETAPFVRAGDVPLHTTHAMHAPACPRQQCRIAEPHVALACPAHALAGEQGSGGGGGAVTRIATDARVQTGDDCLG